ncbi:hypothetical protein VTJ04DRAFT_3567 [Mycothermus thermophilus]|jgi:hypothetical protein|uniref:uncharacterized protein n=1 Tax=Humicola insolens TaxID=85995 RepID=UPI00374248CB
MASFGRFVCVLVPFLLTLAALVAMLVGGLSGVLDKSLYSFRVNLTELSISPDMVNKIVSGKDRVDGIVSGTDSITDSITDTVGGLVPREKQQSNNLTAADLGLYDVYDVNVWNYCYTTKSKKRECTKATFNWAEQYLNTTTNDWNTILTSTGLNLTLPKEMTDAVKAFGTVSRYTQIAFIVAWVALGVELFFGLFANCSRAFSCVTFLIALVAGLVTGTAASLATATAAIVVGAIEATQSVAGLEANLNTRFLAAIWLGVLFALGATFFWMFTICCCAPDHSRSSRSRDVGGEKYALGGLTGAPSPGYQRLSDPNDPNGYNDPTSYNGGYSSGYGQQYPRTDYGSPQAYHGGAYEPYSHVRT